MSKKGFKSQASSSRAAPGTGFGAFGSSVASNTLSYLAEPANLSTITDPNVVVSYKNLSKKDSTTKQKGLEDLRAYVDAHPFEEGGVEDPILEAWVNLYPRLSIDNSRRVRELAHLILCDLLKSARKRMEKHIPKLAGAWLAGTYDKDRTVAKAATTTLRSFLDTDAKVVFLKKQCQGVILDYVQDAINETPETLSDERTMSEDDRQEKYNRVISSSLYLVISLLATLEAKDISKQQEKYEGILLDNKAIWSLASSKDPSLRKVVSELLVACVEHQPGIVEGSLELIAKNVIVKGLHASQTSTASALLSALTRLSMTFPQVWKLAAVKKSASSVLRSFISKGSHSCNEQYWNILVEFLKVLPGDLHGCDIESSELTLAALETGINNKNTTASHFGAAWACYTEVVALLIFRLSEDGLRVKLCVSTVYPLFGKWLDGGLTGQPEIMSKNLTKLYSICASLDGKEAKGAFSDIWIRFGEELIVKIKTSLPEQSQGYKESQDVVIAQGLRWYQFASSIAGSVGAEASSYIVVPSHKILLSALSSTKTRNGKPYSAAAIAEMGLRLLPNLAQSADIQSATQELLNDSFSQMMISPSAKYIITIFKLVAEASTDTDHYREMWEEAIDGILSIRNPVEKTTAITALISLVGKESGVRDSEDSSFVGSIHKAARSHVSLQTYLLDQAGEVMRDNANSTPLLRQALLSNVLDPPSEAKLVELATSDFSATYFSQRFVILQSLFENKPELLKTENIMTKLVVNLFSMIDLAERRDSKEHAFRAIVDSLCGGVDGAEMEKKVVIKAIRLGLHNQTGASIDNLVNQGAGILGRSTEPETYEALLPDLSIWAKGLAHLLLSPPNPSLGLMRPFAGAVFLAKESETDSYNEILNLLGVDHGKSAGISMPIEPIVRDNQGFSMSLRIAMYTIRVFSNAKNFEKIPHAHQETIIRLAAMTRELVDDQISTIEENKLFRTSSDPIALAEVRRYIETFDVFVAEFIRGVKDWTWRDGPGGNAAIQGPNISTTIRVLMQNLTKGTRNGTPRIQAYYSSRIFGRMLEALCSVQAWKSDGGEKWLSNLGVFKTTSTDTLTAQSIIVGIENSLLDSEVIKNFCNRLVSDMADAKPHALNTIDKIVLLNACLEIYQESIPVAKNRIMFAIKNMMSWAPSLAGSNEPLAAEVCHAMQLLLPATRELFGPQWGSTLDFCVSIWESTPNNSLSGTSIPMIGMSLKLYSILKKMEDPNDDLQEALAERDDEIVHGLLKVLGLRRERPSVPMRYIDELLFRILRDLPPLPISDLSDLYPLVASEFSFIQSAAYLLLNKALSEAQQQISVDVLLEKRDAELPEELLSLLLEVPSIHDFTEEEIDHFPPPFRRYLFSWQLVFQSFATASNKVRNDYTEVIKSGDYLGPLLLFMADILGHFIGKPLDLNLAKIDIESSLSPNIEQVVDAEANEKDMYRLLCNLYYLALIRVPMLVKTWWASCPSRSTKIAYESWTEKFFTPLVVAQQLSEVSAWAESQEVPEDEKELIIKTSARSRDVYAGYEVDDLMMQISINLPATYPLQPVTVTSINRVGIPENKWKSFMITTQAVISFSNGSITEGLSTFRRNVVAALKGHTECAICYSIISSDRKTPDKKCSTCNNLFHSKCLYTWFVSSSQSTCPLCRNPFNYSSGARG